MDDELDPTEFLRSVSEWKQNTGSMPSGADLERLAVNFYRQSGGPLSERAAEYTRSQRAEYSDVPQPDDMRKDINPAAGAAASFFTGRDQSALAGGDVGIGIRRGLERGAEGFVDSSFGDRLLRGMEGAAEGFVDRFPGVSGAMARADDALPAGLKMGSEEAKQSLDEGRATADQYAQENFLGGRVPRALGSLEGLIENLYILRRIPGLRGSKVPWGQMTRAQKAAEIAKGATAFGAEQAIVPEIQAGARGEQSRAPHFIPIGQGEDSTMLERMGGRAVEGATIDLALRGAGRAGEGLLGRVGLPARAAAAGGQGAALATLGAAQAPEGQRLEEAGAMGLIGLVSGGAGKRFPPRGRAGRAEPSVEPGPLGHRPMNEARRPGGQPRPEDFGIKQSFQDEVARDYKQSKQSLGEIGDPLWKEMVRGDRPSYLIPGEGNPALLTAGERAFQEPSPKALAAAGIVPVDVPGVGRLYANTEHPLFAGKEDIPGFVRSMKEQGREGEVLGYTESADQTKATHIVTAIGKDGKEVASVRTTDPTHEATSLENVDGIVETVVRPNTPESVVKINKGRLGEMVSEQQAPKAEPVAEQPVAPKPKRVRKPKPVESGEIDARGRSLEEWRSFIDSGRGLERPSEPAHEKPKAVEPVEPPDTRGRGEFFHGTAAEIKNLEEGYYSGRNVYGEGFYTTDDVTTAGSYTKKNRRRVEGAQDNVYRITEKDPVKFYDLDAKVDPEVRKVLEDHRQYLDSLDFALREAGEDASLAKIMDETRASSSEFRESADTVTESFEAIKDNLMGLGYGGFTHKGGNLAGKGKREHQVKIYWRPETQIAHEKYTPGETPKTPQKESNVSRETPTTKPTSSSSSADVARWVRSLDGLSTADRSHLANLGLKSGKTKTGWFVNIPGEGRITVDSGKVGKSEIPPAERPAPKKGNPAADMSESGGNKAELDRLVSERASLQARYEKKLRKDDPRVPPAVKADALSSIAKRLDKVDARIIEIESVGKRSKPRKRDIHTDESGAIDMGRFVDLAKKAVKRTKIEMTDPAKSHELDVEASKRARGKASELIAAVGEATGQRKTARWLTHVTGLPHADPRVRNLSEAMDVFGDKSEARFNQLQEKASRLPAEREREFWLKAEKMESAPKGDPLHDLLIEHAKLARDEGEAMVRAGESVQETVKLIRANAAKLPKGKERNELRRLAVELQRAARLTRERLEHYNQPGERGYVRRFAPQPKGKDGGAKFFARVMAKLRSPGIGDMAKGVEKAARDAYRQRKDLTPEEAEAAGYAVGLMPLVRTWQRAAKIHTTFSTLEYAAKAPEFKPYIRTPSGKLDKSGEWILAKGPGFGALQGKEIHHSLYGLMETMTPKGRNGLVDLMRAASGGLKEGSTVQRIPGYVVKALSGENPLAVWMGGMSPWKFAGRLKTSIPETKRFWLDGKQDAATKLLVDIGLARQSVGMIDSLDTTRGSGIATSMRVSQGKGKEYRSEFRRRYLDHLAERIAAIPENTSISSASRLAEVWNTVREAAVNFDYSRAAGADVSFKPGTFTREAAAISDFVWKHALASELLATGGAGPARMLAQKATGTPTRGMTPAQVSKVLRDFYDPSRLAPWAKAVSNFPVVYDFIRYPLMHTRNLAPASIGGGGHWKRSPIGTAFGVAPARAITAGFVVYLMSQGMSRDEAEEFVDEAANQATGGDEDQKALIAPMMLTEDEDGKPVLRFGVFGQALGLESTYRNPARNVVGNPEESPIGRFFRGLASTSPLGSKLYELSGRDNYLGGQIRSQDTATGLLELTKGFGLPNATAQQWTRRAAKRERAEDMGQDPDVRGGTIGETLFRSLSGFGTRTGYDEDTDKGAAQKSFRRFIEEQAKDMEASRSGAKFSPEMRMPEKYRDDDSPEETARKRELWKRYIFKNPGFRRRLGIE